jgi:hypothetical protein
MIFTDVINDTHQFSFLIEVVTTNFSLTMPKGQAVVVQPPLEILSRTLQCYKFHRN